MQRLFGFGCMIFLLAVVGCGEDGAVSEPDPSSPFTSTSGGGTTTRTETGGATSGGATTGGETTSGPVDAGSDTAQDIGLDTAEDDTSEGADDASPDVPEDISEPEDTSEPEDVSELDALEDVSDASDVAEDAEDDAAEATEVCPPPPANLPDIADDRQGRYVRWAAFEGDGVLRARDVTVYLPEGYDSSPERRYPVLYMHDGQNLFDASQAAFGVEWGVDETMDDLVSRGLIEPWIIVGIHNTQDRVYDYTVEEDPGREAGGNGARYAAWINDRLKPFVDARLRTRCGTHNTAVAGSSLGGLISFEIGQRYPDTFGRIGSLSPSFWWNGGSTMIRFEREGVLPERLWIDSGTEEGGYLLTQSDQPTTGEEDLSSVARDARRVVREALVRGAVYGDGVAYLEEYRGLHNEAAWAYRLGSVFTYLLADREGGVSPASMRAYTTRSALRVGESVAVRIEAELEGGAGRLTWPLEALEMNTEALSALSLDTFGHVRADAEGVWTATFRAGVASTDITLDVYSATDTTSVLFVVSPPFAAPMDVHIAGSPVILGEWGPSGVAMHPMSDGRWLLRVPMGSRDTFEYKYNLSGTWDFVEKGSNGEEVGNRAGLVSSGVLFEDFVQRWAGF